MRNAPGALPKIRGGIHVADGVPSVWLWGLEVTYPEPPAVRGDHCVWLQGPDNRAINNYIHDCSWGGISAWRANRRSTPGQIVYGNLIVRSDHAIYTQNRFEDDGYKYFVNNVILDAAQAPARRRTCCYAFHAYTEQGHVSGMDARRNVFTQEFIMGGKNLPSHHLVVRENLFYRSNASIGYRRPTQVTFVGNMLARGRASFTHWWGGEGGATDRPGPSTVTDNEFSNPPDGRGQFRNMEIRTETFAPDPKNPRKRVLVSTTPRLPADDVFDRNRYSSPPDSMNWWVGGQVQCCGGTFEEWRKAVAKAGNPSFDANSTVVPAPSGVKVVVHPNEYDPERVHVAIVNWGAAKDASTSVPVTVGAALPTGAAYEVRRARDFAGEPVARGTYTGAPVSIPLRGEFDAFVVVASPKPPAP